MFFVRKVHRWTRKLPSPLRNIYFLTVLVFAVWMTFFDKHSLITHFKLNQMIEKMHHDMGFYKEQIEVINSEKKLLESQTERYVREKYFMSRENEDVFIISRK